MKILISVSSLQIGGEQRVVNILANYFVNHGIDVTIFVLSGKVEKQFKFDERVKIIYGNTQRKKMKNIYRIYILRNLIKKEKYNLVIGFAIIPSILCTLASQGICPSIITERNDPAIYSLKMKCARYIAYHFSDTGIFQTKNASDYFPYLKNKFVIPNPLNSNILPNIFEGERKKRIVNTSRLVPEKNQKMLLYAFSELHTKYPDYSLEFYGDGPERDNLINLSVELKINDKVRIYPATNNILDTIRDSSIFVLTSNHEGFPNALAEALAIGIPCISTDCRIGGPHDMIVDNENGMLFPVGNTKELKNKLDILLEDNNLQMKFSKASINIRHELSVEKISEQWIDIMKNMI